MYIMYKYMSVHVHNVQVHECISEKSEIMPSIIKISCIVGAMITYQVFQIFSLIFSLNSGSLYYISAGTVSGRKTTQQCMCRPSSLPVV